MANGDMGLTRDERGQTTVEYVLVAVLIVLGIIFAFRRADINDAIHVAGENVQNSLVVEE